MAQPAGKVRVYLEIGRSKTFAGALDWPGWCRLGRNETSALQALFDYGPRYARVLAGARLGFRAPAQATAFTVVERLPGNATTDFGAPDAAPAIDAQPLDAAELKRCQALLRACWRAFDTAAEAAQGKELRKGPRSGGRDLPGVIGHVVGADHAYLSSLGWPFKRDQQADLGEQLRRLREASLAGLAASARGEIPARGPRGGLRWSPRYYVRRSAWHVLDHAWELEDRSR